MGPGAPPSLLGSLGSIRVTLKAVRRGWKWMWAMLLPSDGNSRKITIAKNFNTPTGVVL